MVRVAQPTPAAVTRARSGPSSLAASTAAITCSTLATSAWANTPPTSLATASPFSGFMSTTTHLAPRDGEHADGGLTEARGASGDDR